jgi:hypothetical protein
LPSAQEVVPWKPADDPDFYRDEALYQYIDGAADLYLEYGFRGVLSQVYELRSELVVVDIFEMEDAEAAFGIYSVRRDHKLPSVGVGIDSTQYDYQLTFCKGPYFVVVSGFESDLRTRESLHQFAAAIASKIADLGGTPPSLGLLPSNGLITRSTGFVKGMIGFNTRFHLSETNLLELERKDVKAVFGEYQWDGLEAGLVLVRYPSPLDSSQKEQLVLKRLEEIFEQERLGLFRDQKGRFYGVFSNANRLVLVYQASSPFSVEQIMEQISR